MIAKGEGILREHENEFQELRRFLEECFVSASHRQQYSWMQAENLQLGGRSLFVHFESFSLGTGNMLTN